ncbi:MAG: CPBP family intramembrane metalloprotease [Bacteroidales bacterium]|nr:CPBP family intramembrane metalloprotease [Bacteroidales bacterium]
MINKNTFWNNKTWLFFEIVLIFIATPLLYYFDVIPGHKSIPLLLVFIILLWALITDKTFDNKHFQINKYKQWRKLIIRFFIISVLLFAYILLFERENLFYLPKHNLLLWGMIMIFYPLWSAYPQELIFRAFFFHRYKALFKNQMVMIICNALLFAYMHFIFKSWVAIGLSFLAGIMFALTYLRSNSLLVVAIEHALYGNLIYTIGLGHYFYVPDF